MTKKQNKTTKCNCRYEAPIAEVIGCSIEGVLCESIRQIDNFELLEEQDW